MYLSMIPPVKDNLNICVKSWNAVLAHEQSLSEEWHLAFAWQGDSLLSFQLAEVLPELQTNSYGGWLSKWNKIVWYIPLWLFSDLNLVANLFLDLLPFFFFSFSSFSRERNKPWRGMPSWSWEVWQSSVRPSWKPKQDSYGRWSSVAMRLLLQGVCRWLLNSSLVLPGGKCR